MSILIFQFFIFLEWQANNILGIADLIYLIVNLLPKKLRVKLIKHPGIKWPLKTTLSIKMAF
jgi:hypothetical protein